MKHDDDDSTELDSNALSTITGGRIQVIDKKTGKEAPRYEVTGTDGQKFNTYMPPKRVN